MGCVIDVVVKVKEDSEFRCQTDANQQTDSRGLSRYMTGLLKLCKRFVISFVIRPRRGTIDSVIK